MAFNIEEFKGQINRWNGVAKDNLFTVEITGAPGDTGVSEQTLVFFCKDVQIPGMQAQTLDYKNQGHGHDEKRVTGMTFEDLSMVFMVDAEYHVQQYFHRWMQSIVNYDNRDYGREYRGMLPFEVAYKDKVVATVTVKVWGQNFKSAPQYEFKFEKVYPINIGSSSLSWSNNDSILTLPVSFSFARFIPVQGVGTSQPMRPREESKTQGGGKSPNSLPAYASPFPVSGFQNALNFMNVDRITQSTVDLLTAQQISSGGEFGGVTIQAPGPVDKPLARITQQII